MTEPIRPAAPGKLGDALLVLNDISVGYRGVPVVKHTSLLVRSAEIALVVGPNGAGKSTLVKAVIGELPLLAGEIFFDGKDVSRLSAGQRSVRGLGYVPQLRDVFPTLTVVENLEMGAYRLPAREVKARIAELFELLPPLAPLRNRKARQLSGGQRKLLAIARGLMQNPKFLILDEPTANLSPKIAQTVLEEVVVSLAGEGRGILLIEQRVALAARIAGNVTVLVDGSVRLSASAAEFRAIPDVSEIFFGTDRTSSKGGQQAAELAR